MDSPTWLRCITSLEKFGLSAQVAQSAIRHVAAKYVSARTAKKHLKRPVRFQGTAMVLMGGERGRDFSVSPKGFSVWTLVGRIKGIPYHGAPALIDYLDTWQMGDGRLLMRKGKVYLVVSFKKEIPEITSLNDGVVGLDRGINVIAAVTAGRQARFFGGGHVKHVRWRYTHIRASLQSKKARKNTRSLRRVLKRLSGREARFQIDVNQVVSKWIVEFAKATGTPVIALEDLKGIRQGRRLRKQQRTDLNRWAFYQLEQFLRYKAEPEGIVLWPVDPKHTSQGCSRCGHTEKANRHGHDFTCKACGYRLHADLNAARNIRLRGILTRQDLAGDGLPSTSPEARSNDAGLASPKGRANSVL